MKILHVTNVAQNAYVNAQILNRAGHENDVAAYDLYHFASSPEWYDLSGADVPPDALGDGYYPDFYSLGRSMPLAPDWVAQGPQAQVLTYLRLRREGNRMTPLARDVLAYLRFKATMFKSTAPHVLPYPDAQFRSHLSAYDLAPVIEDRILNGRIFERMLRAVTRMIGKVIGEEAVRTISPPFPTDYLNALAAHDERMAQLVATLREGDFLRCIGIERETSSSQPLPPLPPGVTEEERRVWLPFVDEWRKLAAFYDVCVFYGDSPIHAYNGGVPQYCAFEYGTIRSIPFEDSTYGRLLREAYQRATKVFITNTDYITASPRMEFDDRQRVFTPHPFDDEKTDAFLASHVARPQTGDAVFLCPARQDWVARDPKFSKNNDHYFRAAAQLLATGVTGFRLKCIAWGTDLEDSLRLIDELGISDHVEWISPVSKISLWREMCDATAVIDQFLLSVLSGVGFEALALGRRLITRDDGRTNLEFFGESIPGLHANSVDELAIQMRRAIEDREDSAGTGAAGRAWIKRHHSAGRIVEIQMKAFADMAAQAAAENPAHDPDHTTSEKAQDHDE